MLWLGEKRNKARTTSGTVQPLQAHHRWKCINRAIEMMKQSLQAICHWERENSNSSLQIRADECKRLDNFEFFPVAMALCRTWTCIGSFQILYQASSLSEFSLGIVYLREYGFDFNLADCIGKIPMSWGICQTGYAASKIYANQSCIKTIPSIKNRDIITIYMDLNEGDDKGVAYFFVNKQHVWSLHGLVCDESYAMACTMSPDSKVTIKDKAMTADEALSLVEQSDIDDKNEDVLIQSEVKVYPTYSIRETNIPKEYDIKEQQGNPHHWFDPFHEHISPSESKIGEIDKISEGKGDARTSTPTPTSTPNHSLPVPTFFPSKSLLAPKSPKTKDMGDKINVGDHAHAMECCVCMTNTRCMLFMPCKHLCTCEKCGGDGEGG
ncbi:RING-HC finger protein, partial [archaeon]